MSHFHTTASTGSVSSPAQAAWAYHAVPRKPVPSSATREAVGSLKQTTKALPRNEEDQSRPSSSTNHQLFLHIWWLELACCLLAIAMLVAVIFTLLPYQHQPLPSLPYHISINTLISVLITAMKASSLVVLAEGLGQLKWEYLKTPRPLQHLQDYDTASRGPWGCLKLLVALRGHGILTSIGAVISILIIAVDPFGQQLVGYYSCNVPLTNGTVATIPRSSIYNELGLSRYRAGNGPSGSPTTAQRNAVVNGFFAPDSVKTVRELYI